MRVPKTKTLLLLSALLPAAAPAEGTDDATIVVTATRTEQPISAVGQSISVLDSADIARLQSTAVADLLRELPGVALARTGGPGAITSVFVRGANADQTIVLIDGVKLNDPSSTAGGFFFGDLLTGNVERIELLRGPQSVLWGSQSIGGVVNLITREPTDRLAINLRGEQGWRDSTQLVGNISGRTGIVSASLGGGLFRTDGNSALAERLGGIERDGYRNVSANAKVGIALGEGMSLDLRGWFTRGRVESDDVDALMDTDDLTRNRQWVGYAGLNAKALDGRLANRLAISFTDVKRHVVSQSYGTSDYRGSNRRLEYQGSYDIAEGYQATFGLEHERQRADRFAAADPDPATNMLSVYAELLAAPLPGLDLTAGARHDHHSSFGGHWTLGASAAWRPWEGSTRLHAAYGEGFKAPSLYQLKGNFGANPDLEPETAHGWEAGIGQRLGGIAEVDLTYFERRTRNLIDFPSTSYVNVARAFARGVEFQASVRPVDALALSFAYSHVLAENRTPGHPDAGLQLPRRPKDSLSASIDHAWPGSLRLGASARWTGARRDAVWLWDGETYSAQPVRLGRYTLVDIRARYPLGARVELFGRVENLLDERYETTVNFGNPGRAAFVGLELRY